MGSKVPFVVVCEHTLYERDLYPGSTVLDLGANRGEFSRTLSERFGCSCLAVEPNPSLYEVIEEGPRVRKYQYAIWSNTGKMEFHLSGNSESSSLLPLPEGEEGRKVVVPTINLETFVRQQALPKVDLLKVDVEGAEITVFDSVSDEFLSSIKQISIEFHDFIGLVKQSQVDALCRRLVGLGFLMLKFSLRSHFDVLFLNQRAKRGFRLNYWGLMLAPYYLKLRQYLSGTRA